MLILPWFGPIATGQSQDAAGGSGSKAQAPAGSQAGNPSTGPQAGDAHAQEALAAMAVEGKPKREFALFRTAALDPKLQELGAALDPVVLSELNAIGGIEVAARPALDLPAMQLAIDCVGEIAECMAAVAREAGVEALVAPVLRSNGDLVLVTLLYFDTRENQIKGVTRQLGGRSVAQAMLDAAPEMVREAFGLPPESVESRPATDKPAPLPPADEPSPARRIVPWVLLGVSVATGAVGIGMGVASNKAEDRYGKGSVNTEQQIDATVKHKDDAEDKALIANVCFGIAGAAAVASFATWLVFREPAKQSEPSGGKVALVPQFSRSQVGLSLQGMFGR
ncbi:MAG: hypothetical protein QM778_13540 [Myxococcales bacterium]